MVCEVPQAAPTIRQYNAPITNKVSLAVISGSKSHLEVLADFLDITDDHEWMSPCLPLAFLFALDCHFAIEISLSGMQFLQKELCRRTEWRPSSTISSISPNPFDSSSNNVPIDASMTLGGLPPLCDVNIESNHTPDTALTSASGNEIVTAFASLDAEVEQSLNMSDLALSTEFQCRYRRGKCSRPRTLKKNGSMHTYCEYHRQRSVRNQRVFDHKKRHQRQTTSETQEEGRRPEYRD